MDVVKDFNMAPVSASLLRVGEPTEFPIYDEFGRLLLREGQVVQSEHQRDILCQLGRYPQVHSHQKEDRFAPEPFDPNANPFAEFEDLVQELRQLFDQLLAGTELPEGRVENRLFRMAARIHGLQTHHADALIGAVHLCHDHEYPIRHALQVAIIADLLATECGFDHPRRLGLSAAALTANLAMVPYQARLEAHRGSLNEKQRAFVQRHPEQAVALLRRAGVPEGTTWLRHVLQHHERQDGSGYPTGLTGEAITTEAHLVALADVYTAMITPRSYRPPLPPVEGLRELYRRAGQHFDPKLTRQLINELSLYPPGSCVDLANGELAIVIGRSHDPRTPRVTSLRKPTGEPFLAPRRRNTADEGFRIQRVRPVSAIPTISPSWVWGI